MNKIDLVSFDRLRHGDVFMFSMKDRTEFKKLGDHTYISMRQSPEVCNVEKGQSVFIKTKINLKR